MSSSDLKQAIADSLSRIKDAWFLYVAVWTLLLALGGCVVTAVRAYDDFKDLPERVENLEQNEAAQFCFLIAIIEERAGFDCELMMEESIRERVRERR